ncbi:MAG: hypothetical protein JKY96_02190 [Phycisphaerales bacterium]|nr:hypothetical protein [Phycisphaerales bacterium]
MANPKDEASTGRSPSAAGVHRSDWAIKGQQTKAQFQRAAAGQHQKAAQKSREKPTSAHHREPSAHERNAAGKSQQVQGKSRFSRVSNRIAHRQHNRELGLGR